MVYRTVSNFLSQANYNEFVKQSQISTDGKQLQSNDSILSMNELFFKVKLWRVWELFCVLIRFVGVKYVNIIVERYKYKFKFKYESLSIGLWFLCVNSI